MSEIELETEFEKINLEEGSSKSKDESAASKCDCKKIIVKSSEHPSSNTGSSLKVIDKRKNLIKPARLKLLGTCWARRSRNNSEESTSNELKVPASDDIDTFASEAFLRMRISPGETLTQVTSSSLSQDEKDERISPTSQPNSCSAQAKLQQQFSSSEFDSTIDEMAEVLAYHLNLYPQDKNFLVDSIYT